MGQYRPVRRGARPAQRRSGPPAARSGRATSPSASWERGATRTGQRKLDELFTSLGESFSECTSYEFELLAYDVVGDMAFTAGFEHTSASVDGRPRTYTLRATQVYRREQGEWRVAHRDGDTIAS